jgi:hypothetical protein
LTLRRRLAADDGFAVIEGLLAFGLILLVVAVAVQAFSYAHARSVAFAAAQDGVETAASSGPYAGTARADAVLAAAGGVGTGLRSTVATSGNEVTMTVAGPAPSLFPLGLLMPSIEVRASVPLERYPTDEAAP